MISCPKCSKPMQEIHFSGNLVFCCGACGNVMNGENGFVAAGQKPPNAENTSTGDEGIAALLVQEQAAIERRFRQYEEDETNVFSRVSDIPGVRSVVRLLSYIFRV